MAAPEPVMAAASSPQVVQAALVHDGRALELSVPGLGTFKGRFSADVRIGGENKVLASDSGVSPGVAERVSESTPLGNAELSVVTFRFEEEQVDLMLRFGRTPGASGYLLQAGVRNTGQRPLELLGVMPVDVKGPVTGKLAEWLITSLHSPNVSTIALDDVSGALEFREAGTLYRADGSGLLFGPVGVPTAYVDTGIVSGPDGSFALRLRADMSGAQVEPGAVRWGQQVVLLAEAPAQAVPRWVDWVGKTHGARTGKGAVFGWNNWNYLRGSDNGSDVFGLVEMLRGPGDRLRLGVIQIGESRLTALQILDAPWLPEVSRQIAQTGTRFGVRLGFNPRMSPETDGGECATMEEFCALVRRAVGSGFRYLKVSCGTTDERAEGEKRTSFEIRRDEWTAIRRAAGEDTYLLACGKEMSTDRAVVGIVDASRTGGEATRRGVRGIMKDVLRAYPLNGRWFAVDNDVFYVAAEDEGLREVAGGWPLVRTWQSMVGLSCGAAVTSEPLYWGNFRRYWRNVEILSPPAREHTEVLRLGTSAEWPALVGHVRRPWGDSTVALLWNPGAVGQVARLDFAEAGMKPNRRYAVWSFWDNQFLGVAKDGWTTPMLTKAASQHLLFTDLDRKPDSPVLIGSNLHIYCGATEIKEVASSPGAMRIELTDAGAREGDLMIYSRWQPVLKAVTGCAATGVVAAGEKVWRISLVDRKFGSPQSVDLEIVLPVNRQGWFWMLLALVAASMVFAGFRYVTSLRLQREHALDQERARIARDMHDEVGASLTKIGKLAAGLSDPAIANTTREVVRAMDQIVWTINPRNDTLDSLVTYLLHFTEEFLRPAGVAFDLDVPLDLPRVMLSADVRNNLFLAVKEALNNAVKHGAPRRVRLALSVVGELLTLTVRDDGRGFYPETLSAGADGLANMRQRLAALGGELQVTSAPGHGTTVTMKVRLNH